MLGGGKTKRYAALFSCDKYITLDINPENNPDIVASADKIPLEENSVDSIICTQVLGDVKEPVIVLKEFYRILKSGGHVLLTESLLNELHDEPNDFWRFTEFGLGEIFRKSGFRVLETDQRGGFFASQAQLKVRYLIDKFNLCHKKWSFILRPLIRYYSKFMIFLDKIDKNKANRKHALGWCVLAKKDEKDNSYN
jgi:SAM-dependent methyltransferase